MITSHSAALSSQQCPQKVEDAKDKEETEESLGIATEIDTIIFLVMLVDLLALVGKHSIDFLQLALYLDLYLLVMLVKHLQHLLPVCFIDIYRHL